MILSLAESRLCFYDFEFIEFLFEVVFLRLSFLVVPDWYGLCNAGVDFCDCFSFELCMVVMGTVQCI